MKCIEYENKIKEKESLLENSLINANEKDKKIQDYMVLKKYLFLKYYLTFLQKDQEKALVEINSSNAETIKILETSIIEVTENLAKTESSYENCLMDLNKKEQIVNEMSVSFYLIKFPEKIFYKILFFRNERKCLLKRVH